MNSRRPGRSRAARPPLRPHSSHKAGDGIAGPLRNGSVSHGPPTRRLRYEPLEDRRLLAIVTVDTILDTVDFNDGKTSLREAIFATNTVSGTDEIRFDPALFAGGPAMILLTQGELKITDSLTLTGPGADLLTIDATPAEGQAGSRIFSILAPSGAARIDATLTGLTLAGGRGSDGGAIFADANLAISDARLIDNIAGHTGGAISITAGRLELTRVELADNSANTHAGAIFARGQLVVSDSVFLRNSTTNGAGGAILHTGFETTVHIADSRFEQNSAARGGAISAPASPLTIDDCVFIANTATFNGGALQAASAGINRDKLVLIVSSTFERNTAGNGAGALSTGGNVEIRASTISGNSSSSVAGGIYHGPTGSLLIEDSVLANNSAQRGGGGGIFAINSVSITILGSTIEGNTAASVGQGDVFGGGVFMSSRGTQSALLVRDSTIRGNFANGHGGGVAVIAQSITIADSVVTGNTAGDLSARRGHGGGLHLEGNTSGSVQILRSTVA